MKLSSRTVRKTFFWIALLLAFTFVQMVAVDAASEATIRVEPYANFANVGESFTVNITLTSVQNLYGVEVTLYWNASILKIVDVNVRLGVESHPDGVLHENAQVFKNEATQAEGKYLLAGASTSPAPPFSGNGNIAIITFNVTNIGYSRLDLATKLSDWPPPDREPRISWPIAHNTVDGFFGRYIGVSAYPTVVGINENVTVSGFVVPAQADIEVTVTSRREGETNWNNLSSIRTNEQGNYQFIWQPQQAGKYEIKTTALIGDTLETSSSVFVTVKAPEYIWQYVTIAVAVILVATVITILIYRKRRRKTPRTGKRALKLASLWMVRLPGFEPELSPHSEKRFMGSRCLNQSGLQPQVNNIYASRLIPI